MSLRARLGPVARQAMKATAAGVDVVRRPAHGITILIYHRVGAGAGGQMDLSPEAFDEQLTWLSATQRLLTLDQALDELHEPGAVVPVQAGTTAPGSAGSVRPGVVVTFDDGTTDWVDHVLPALERHHVPATFYVATSFVDEQLPFPGEGTPITWAGLEELAASALVTLGSHTHTHALLDRLPGDRIADELDRSTELLGEHTGVTVEHFAYPKAVPGSPAADAAVRARFHSAVIAGTKANQLGADPFALRRSPIQPTDGSRWFRRKAAGGLGAEDDLRRVLNRVRYRGADS